MLRLGDLGKRKNGLVLFLLKRVFGRRRGQERESKSEKKREKRDKERERKERK